jgi:prepilin-type N-terminal cleavage/methylation domain-containing protein
MIVAARRSGRRSRRSGLTLLELIAVVTILGIIGLVTLPRYGPALFGAVGAQAEARRISLAMQTARQGAISTGLDHAVAFAGSGSGTNFSIVSLNGGSRTLVDGPYTVASGVTVGASAADMVFNFEGQAGAAYQVTVAGSGRTFVIDVIPINGAISVVATP